jgi:hypothetical protein
MAGKRHWAGLASVGGWVLACSGSGSSSLVPADTACEQFSDALCKRIQECAPIFIQYSYGDVATCSARSKLSCVPTVNAPGSALSGAQIAACANALPTPSCDDLLARAIPDDCRARPGNFADGQACADDNQCTNKKCKKKKDASCGVCSSPVAAGGACDVDDNCDYGLLCAKNGVCVSPGAGGAICDANHVCRASFICRGGTCVQAPAEGTACNPSAQDCSFAKGDFCDPTAQVCKPLGMVQGGQACGIVSQALALCAASGTCKVPAGLAQGTCVGASADGQPCDATNGPACTPPATCDSGACKIPDPAACK